MKLEVSFPSTNGSKTITRQTLNEILNICKKMSTEEYQFNFKTPMFMVIEE